MSMAEKKTGILGWLKGLFTQTSLEDSLEDRIQSVIIKIREHQDSINEFAFRMQRRAEELYAKVTEHLKKSQSPLLTDDERRAHYNLARTFAEEIVEIKKFTKAVRFVAIGLEKVAQRLQTVKDVKDLQEQLGPIRMLLVGLKQEVESVFPAVGTTIDDINRAIAELMIHSSSGLHELNSLDSYTKDEEVNKIIRDAWSLATATVESVIPEPTTLIQNKQPAPSTAKKSPEPIDVTLNKSKSEQVALPSSSAGKEKPKLEEIEKIVLEEAKINKGRINVDDISSRYKLRKDDVFDALESLRRKGKIRIVGTA